MSMLLNLVDLTIDCPAEAALQRRLANQVRRRLTPNLNPDEFPAAEDVAELRGYLHRERQYCADLVKQVPTDADDFITWFEALMDTGPGQHDPLFPWLADEADDASMRWFLRQELAGEAGFDDLVAMALIRMPVRAKMEMARNLWDEFGRGNPAGVHSTLLASMAQTLGISCSIEDATSEALALANLMAGLALEHFPYHAVGALGVIELTAPGRVSCVANGMRRLGMPLKARRYYELHATLDIEHARRWNEEVLGPIVASDPRTAHLLAQGAIMRLEAGRRCFERYRFTLMPS